MENSKFSELCNAFGKARKDFQKFEEDCHSFAIDLVKKFKEYLQVPESQFSLYTITQTNEFQIVPPSLLNAMTMGQGSYWQFGIGLTLCEKPESLPQDLILIQLLVRKDLHEKYFVKLGSEEDEFLIEREKPDAYNLFFDFLHNKVITTYRTEFQRFIGQSNFRKLGFKFKDERDQQTGDYK